MWVEPGFNVNWWGVNVGGFEFMWIHVGSRELGEGNAS